MVNYFKKQYDFLRSKIKELVMLASMGVGKTFILGEFVAHYLQDNIDVDHSAKKGHGVAMLVVCSTVATMTDTIIEAIEDSFDRYGMEYRRAINSKKFIVTQYREDGTSIKHNIYLRTSEKRSEIAGFRVHATVMEEAIICHKECWPKIKQRTNLGKNPIIRIISSLPLTKSHHLYDFYGPHVKRKSLQIIKPTLFDNCYRDNALELMKDQIFNTYYLELKKGITEADLDKLIKIYWEFSAFDDEKAETILREIKELFEDISPEAQAELFSEWVEAGSSNAYRRFSRKLHVKDQSELPQKKFGQIWLGMDFNRTPYSILKAQYSNGKLRIYQEQQLPNMDSEMASEMTADYLKEREFFHHQWHSVVSDSTGGNKSTKPWTDWDYIEEAGLNLELTQNPFWKNRVNNVNRWFKEGRIEIDPSCKTLIKELEVCTMDDMEQKKEGKFYHAVVVLGYLCWFIEPYAESSKPNVKVY